MESEERINSNQQPSEENPDIQIIDTPYPSKIYKTDNLSEIIHDDEGAWCTIKYAIAFSGVSDSTIRRRISANQIKHQKINTTYGDATYLYLPDIEAMAASNKLATQKTEMKKEELFNSLIQFLDLYESQQLGNVQGQLTEISDHIDSIEKHNQELEDKLSESLKTQESLQSLLAEQLEINKHIRDELDRKIKEAEEEPEKTGFFSRLFGKKR